MKRLLILFGLMAVLAVVGCSDSSNNPVGPSGSGGVTPAGDTTVFDAGTGEYTTTLTAKATTGTIDFSEITGAKSAAVWDIKFQNSLININGGASADGGDVYTYDLGEAEFDSVSADDTVGITWEQDALQHIVNGWYSYNFQTHQLDMTNYVYTLTDAEGDNYVEMRIDSITGGGQPPAMGTVWFTYYYNPTANSKDLSGTSVVGSVEVTQANGFWGHFDFESGSQVFPATASTSSDWDIGFSNYELFLNSGPNGPGSVTAFPMHGELTDPTSLVECTAQPAMAPMFQDYIASVFNGDINDASSNWYNYNGASHELTSKAHVYLVSTGTELYKLRIDSYYRNLGGVPTSGYYTLTWSEL